MSQIGGSGSGSGTRGAGVCGNGSERAGRRVVQLAPAVGRRRTASEGPAHPQRVVDQVVTSGRSRDVEGRGTVECTVDGIDQAARRLKLRRALAVHKVSVEVCDLGAVADRKRRLAGGCAQLQHRAGARVTYGRGLAREVAVTEDQRLAGGGVRHCFGAGHEHPRDAGCD